ncbi:uncharacterized protein LOC131167612 [Malania oleifera]|uniref:uncharacterized protein LOC131167612 n=1 Tax=Malania oleifera TaxID=397392 RepID=UPI0025AE9F80|nr:uncharacterized protein LOC131167612 [Malania oleifera]
MDAKERSHRKLNFNAPLLSVRRASGLVGSSSFSNQFSQTTHLNKHVDAIERVPFSWEQAPGKPKEPKALSEADDDDDHDLNDDNDDDDDFSDAIDIFSLSDLADQMPEPVEQKVGRTEQVEGSGKCSSSSIGSQSPNFLISRFLPAASALALSNISKLSLNKEVVMPPQSHRPSCESPKSCGLEAFFPNWRMKHKLCGVKNPVRHGTPSRKNCSARVKGHENG